MIGADGISPAVSISQPLTARPGATVKGTADAKLKEMATEMEATFLAMLLKEMRETLDPDEGGLFPGDSGDVQGGLFDLFMSRHLADSGGVGVAASLIRQVQAGGTPAPAKTPPTTHAPAPVASPIPPASGA
jgi:flagellar protein FlgJ